MTCDGLLRDDIDIDAAKSRCASDEVLIDERLREADRFEDLCAGVGSDGRDTHLRHHLQDPLAKGFDEIAHCFLWADAGDDSTQDQIFDTFHSKVRIYCCCTKADEERDMMDLADLATLDDQSDSSSCLLANQMMMNRSGKKE
ncbi:unannotated protein [freshwater metagenome]|uniref:Unannotated protein n=1 Tax=freshwater metagenome TaxID=449393 RepID=A0A6J6DB85_9ZZZZ